MNIYLDNVSSTTPFVGILVIGVRHLQASVAHDGRECAGRIGDSCHAAACARGRRAHSLNIVAIACGNHNRTVVLYSAAHVGIVAMMRQPVLVHEIVVACAIDRHCCRAGCYRFGS